MENDPLFRLGTQMRIRISNAIRRCKGSKKAAGLHALLGCSIGDFRAHLESRFQEGMGWHNYGEWQIDHIKPCASFNLTEPEEQRKCFHYTNCQPLWACDNQRKEAKAL